MPTTKGISAGPRPATAKKQVGSGTVVSSAEDIIYRSDRDASPRDPRYVYRGTVAALAANYPGIRDDLQRLLDSGTWVETDNVAMHLLLVHDVLKARQPHQRRSRRRY